MLWEGAPSKMPKRRLPNLEHVGVSASDPGMGTVSFNGVVVGEGERTFILIAEEAKVLGEGLVKSAAEVLKARDPAKTLRDIESRRPSES